MPMKKLEMGSTRKFPRFKLADVDLADDFREVGFAVDLALEVVVDEFLVSRAEAESQRECSQR